ncbi:hypothetical protein F183_A05980 [Bryobacterales bacterium F-183]|nr:hypothetical protein F183_A05980 [Bryobacterales bacterium F-183]
MKWTPSSRPNGDTDAKQTRTGTNDQAQSTALLLYTTSMRLILSAFVLCLCTTATVQADVILGNLPPVNDSSSTNFIAGGGGKAIGFTMTTTMRLTSARLRLSSNLATHAPNVYLMSNSGNNPTTVLATFQTPTLGAGLADYLFTLQTPYDLVSGSSYWLTLAGNSTTSGLIWRASTVSSTPTGASATYLGARLGGSFPLTLNSSVINSFELIGFAPPPAAVPEPSAIATLSAAVLGLGLCTRLRLRRTIHS